MNDTRALTNRTFHYHLKETETSNPINKNLKVDSTNNIKQEPQTINTNDNTKKVNLFKKSDDNPVIQKFNKIETDLNKYFASENLASKLDKMKPEEIKKVISSISNNKSSENISKKLSEIIVSMQNKDNMQEVFNNLDGDLFDNIINSIPQELDKMPIDKSISFFKQLAPSATAKFLDKMPPEKIAKVLDTFEKESSGKILSELSKLDSNKDGKNLANIIVSMQNKENMQNTFDLIDGELFDNVINSIPQELEKMPIDKSIEFYKRLTPDAIEKFLEKTNPQISSQIRLALK
ncbi:MAG: hypothetical protein U0354_19505 [Candidatus Sericytochromatia bacterium]